MKKYSRMVFDTDVFIGYRRHITPALLSKMALSSVVLCELAGTTISHDEFDRYKELQRAYAKHNLLLTPTEKDWWAVTQSLFRLRHGEKSASHGYVDKDPHARALQNDGLIAYTAHAHKCFVVTNNLSDFNRLKPFLKFDVQAAQDFFGF